MKRIALTTIAAASFLTVALGTAAVTPASAQSFGVYIGRSAPAPYYAPPVQRVWVPGYWTWHHGRQVWVDGRWRGGPQPVWNRGWGWGHD
ncbi:MAG: YXWGXW repeat-containing protein [Alphaproteobacteria bacterium]|nr:YXWGXW repeat-containing protein [Alphaproteobacteria bacterium]